MNDPQYWNSLDYPKKPNQHEVSLFKSFCSGNVLLLGETKGLRHLATNAVDMFPTGYAKVGDWFNLDGHYDTIIGDGVLNLTGLSLVDKLKNNCSTLVVRVFTDEIQNKYTWKYAKYFPNTFNDSFKEIKTQEGCVIVVWKFK